MRTGPAQAVSVTAGPVKGRDLAASTRDRLGTANTAFAAGTVQFSLLLQFLELIGYRMNAVRRHVYATDVLVRCGVDRDDFR